MRTIFRRRVRIVRYPPHEDSIAECQQRCSDKHTQDTGGSHAPQRAQQDHRHGSIDAAAEQERLKDVVDDAGDQQQYG